MAPPALRPSSAADLQYGYVFIIHDGIKLQAKYVFKRKSLYVFTGLQTKGKIKAVGHAPITLFDKQPYVLPLSIRATGFMPVAALAETKQAKLLGGLVPVTTFRVIPEQDDAMVQQSAQVFRRSKTEQVGSNIVSVRLFRV